MIDRERRLINAFTELNFFEWKKTEPNKIIFSTDVYLQCEKNTCGMFGKNYACPPLAGNTLDRQTSIIQYRNAYVISYVGSIKSRADMQESNEKFTAAVNQLRKTFMKDHVIILGAGPCDRCQTCAALKEEPCRFPDEIRYSMEGSGIDVVKTSMDLGMTYNAGHGKAAFFALVLF